MAAIGLGDVEDFPFLDPPDRRQVRDGVNLLHELGALDPAGARTRLTTLGRRLAQLPVDPRMGRMVLEADRLGCADEVIVIAAALSIQDPRERPADERAQADQLHARFADETSDFLAFLNLWRHLREQQRELSGNQFRKRCRAEFLHYLRIREWQDLVGQLRQAAKGVGVTLNREPAEPRDVHVALLAGLLSHVGLRDAARREYLGARGARFAIFPGSALSRAQPAWVMVAELVETSRLWGRTAARIEPRVGRAAGRAPPAAHLRRAALGRASAARVVATERVTLYGLPIVAGRTVAYGADRPGRCRASCSSAARWSRATGRPATRSSPRTSGGWRRSRRSRTARAGATSSSRPGAVRLLRRARSRRTSSRARTSTAGGATSAARDPDLLTFTRELLVDADGGRARPARAARAAWRQGDLMLPLSYRFEPGARRTTASPSTCRSTALGAAAPGRLRLARARRCGSSS